MKARIGLVLALVLGGCAFMGEEPARMYRLSAALDDTTWALLAATPQLQVEIQPLDSNRPQGGSLGILVAEVGEVVEVEEFAVGRWEEPPETALARALITALKRAGGAPLAATNPQGQPQRLRLRWSLDQFEMVEARAGASYVSVALSLRLLDNRTRVELAAGEILEREPLPPEPGLDAVVLAFDRASSRALSQVVQCLIAADEQPGSRS